MSEQSNIASDDATTYPVGQNLENMRDGYPVFHDFDISTFSDSVEVSSS